MSRSRFVRPDVDVLKISNGDTLTVRKRLNEGEQRAMFARMYSATDANGRLRVNPLTNGPAIVLAYLVDWSLTDDGGLVVIRDQPIDVVAAAVDALDPIDFREIRDAIEAHVEAQTILREQEKNAVGESGSSATSPSAV